MGTNLKMAQDLLELGATTNFIRNSRVYIDLDSQENFPEVEKILRANKWCIVGSHTNKDGSMGIRAI